MKINYEVLFQVATNRNFKVGDKIHFGNEFNGQMKIFNFTFNKDGKPLHELGLKSSKQGIIKDKKLLFEMSVALQNYDLFMREIALEEVRKEKFPNFPSRFKCMYLSDNKDIVIKNLNIMHYKFPENQYQAISVKLNGEIFYAKDFGIGRYGLSFNEYKILAEKYWSQNQNSNSPTKEILFVGDAEIVEVFKDTKIKT